LASERPLFYAWIIREADQLTPKAEIARNAKNFPEGRHAYDSNCHAIARIARSSSVQYVAEQKNKYSINSQCRQ
jgi:hypothetical protein